MNDTLWTIIAAGLLILLMIGNRKVRLISLFSKQIQVFKNARKNKISVWDILCFIVFPICLALIVVYKLGICIDDTLSGILTTVFFFGVYGSVWICCNNSRKTGQQK